MAEQRKYKMLLLSRHLLFEKWEERALNLARGCVVDRIEPAKPTVIDDLMFRKSEFLK